MAVTGNKVVVTCGWDVYCLEDRGDRAERAYGAERVWIVRTLVGVGYGGIPVGVSISGEQVFVGSAGMEGGNAGICSL